MIRIIDHKKVDLTNDEYETYQQICRAYTTTTAKGEDFFIDLFESNDDGIITFIKPPSKRMVSMEIFLFIVSLFCHQHVRLMHSQIDDLADQIKEKLKEIK